MGLFPGGRRAGVSLTFDDARASQVDVGMELLDRAGVRATFYVSPGALQSRADGWRAAVAAGHEIGNHTMTHPCTGNFAWSRHPGLEEMTLEQMERELLDANETIRQTLGVTPRTFAYPCGMTFVGRSLNHQSYVRLVAKHFIAGRLFRAETTNDPDFCDLPHLFAYESDRRSFAELKVLADNAIAQGHWLILAGHEIGEEGRQTTLTAALADFVRYCQDCQEQLVVDTVDRIATCLIEHRKSAARSASGETACIA